MSAVIETSSREEFIDFGRAVGEVLRQSTQPQPWFITLNGDEDGGKSLIALAIDQAFNPRRYPESGPISKYDTVELKLEPQNDGRPRVVFDNFLTFIPKHEADFDDVLRDFGNKNPDARVLIASNFERMPAQPARSFDDSSGLNSKLLDMNLNVSILPGAFSRRIEITTANDHLLPKIIARYNAVGSAGPKRPGAVAADDGPRLKP